MIPTYLVIALAAQGPHMPCGHSSMISSPTCLLPYDVSGAWVLNIEEVSHAGSTLCMAAAAGACVRVQSMPAPWVLGRLQRLPDSPLL